MVTPTDSHSHGNQDSDNPSIHCKKGSFVQGAFKDRKFTGDLKQPIDQTIRLYEMVANQQNLSDKQKSDFFMYTLEEPALTFFSNNYEFGQSYESILKMMRDEYNSDARMIHVRGKLTSLRLRKFMQDNELKDESSALSELVILIEQLVPQTNRDFRSDSHKIEYLRNAVAEFPHWSRGPIKNISTNKYTFNAFVTSLHESIQTENVLERESGSSNRLPTHHVEENRIAVHAVNQYGRPSGRNSRPLRKNYRQQVGRSYTQSEFE